VFFVIRKYGYADRTSNDVLGASWCETQKRTVQAFDTVVSALASSDDMSQAVITATGRAMPVTKNGSSLQGFDALRAGN